MNDCMLDSSEWRQNVNAKWQMLNRHPQSQRNHQANQVNISRDSGNVINVIYSPASVLWLNVGICNRPTVRDRESELVILFSVVFIATDKGVR